MSSEMCFVRAAETIAATAEAEGRKLTPQEQAEARRLLQLAKDERDLEAQIQQMGQAFVLTRVDIVDLDDILWSALSIRPLAGERQDDAAPRPQI